MINSKRLADMRKRYPAGDPAAPSKYLDVDVYLKVNRARASELGLDGSPRRRVLDLGCGCGYFLAVCQSFGHAAIGIDRINPHPLYVEMTGLLGVTVIQHDIVAFSPLPDVGQVDVVTAHQVCFNQHNTGRPWGALEWAWILDALPAKTVCLELNREADGTLFPPGLREFFEERGAHIDEHRVLIDR